MSARFGQLLAEPHGHALRVLSATSNLHAQTLADAVARLAACLQTAGLTRVASRLDNGPDWLILDLALRLIDAVHVPLPTFFSDGQVLHALTSSGAQCVVTDAAAAAPPGTSGPTPSAAARCAALLAGGSDHRATCIAGCHCLHHLHLRHHGSPQGRVPVG